MDSPVLLFMRGNLGGGGRLWVHRSLWKKLLLNDLGAENVEKLKIGK